MLTVSVSGLFPCVFSPSSTPTPQLNYTTFGIVLCPSASSICSSLPGHSMTYKRVEISLTAKKKKKKKMVSDPHFPYLLPSFSSILYKFPPEKSVILLMPSAYILS